MKKTIFVVFFYLICFSTAFSQDIDYFGSIVIPKNDYFIRCTFTNLYVSVNINNQEIHIAEQNNKVNEKFMFIPAGNGYYFIKSQLQGNYLTIASENFSKGTLLKINEPIRDDSQKFKVISLGNNKFKFVAINKLVIQSNGVGNNDMKLGIWDDNGGVNQTFEILESESMKKLD